MAKYKLSRSSNPSVHADSVILKRDEKTGEVSKEISFTNSVELSDQEAEKLRSQGFNLVEADEDDSDKETHVLDQNVAGQPSVTAVQSGGSPQSSSSSGDKGKGNTENDDTPKRG
jgi:hypothetical protein